MRNHELNNNNFYIAISGNIASGKTTLTKALSKELNIKMYEEPVLENPFLEPYYKYLDLHNKDPGNKEILQKAQKWGYALQEFFLLNRVIDHKKIMMFNEPIIQDRSIYEDKEIFARNSYDLNLISEEDFQKYLLLYNILASNLKAPDILIYLETSVPTLKSRVKKRIEEEPTRENEKELAEEKDYYLKNLNHRYKLWINNYDKGPKLIMNTDEKNFEENPRHLEVLVEEMKRITNISAILK
ncbi:MAG: deoxynucleoside kinase [Nanoarchaeota archaeon]|nr:deoxynucleoside kinase [Nanoarchaeota archaeon]MBU1269865.1 deoxynucleoside kinase [Nanoarchaeota archaeon]MBU1603999.1 deoxynucleoside kinase [Nanoarchaeota archaeon]MBU2443290.1 deoxynucleoside kinase [Nanoarchaeota archaeon]